MKLYELKTLPGAKWHCMVLFLVILDTVSKIAAYILLPLHKNIPLIGEHLFFCLSINTTGVPTYLRTDQTLDPMPDTYNMMGSLMSLILTLIIFVLIRVRWSRNLRISAGILAFIGFTFLTFLTADHFTLPKMSAPILGAVSRVGPTTLIVMLYCIFENRYLKVVFSFGAACALGNLFSFFYPPFGIVDFIFCDAVDFLRTYVGIFNLADIYSVAFDAGCLIWPVYAAIRYIHKRRSADQRSIA